MPEPLRQFAYISPTKVAGLESQLKRRLPRPELRARIGVPGAEVEVSGGSEQHDDLMGRTLRVERKLRRRGLIKSLAASTEIDASTYYADEATWWNGLFAFNGDFSLDDEVGRVVSYLLWRPWQDSLILLAGAPENVLGERVVRDGVWAYGTTGTWATILRFAETSFETDEPSFETASETRTDEPVLGREIAPHSLFDAPRGLALAVICARYLSTLPETSIQTVFRVTQRFGIRTPGFLPSWAVDALGGGPAGESRLALVRRCDAVYVGSPLFTALV